MPKSFNWFLILILLGSRGMIAQNVCTSPTTGSTTNSIGADPTSKTLVLPSARGIDYVWGEDNFGHSTYDHWLGTLYSHSLVERDLQVMKQMKTLDVDVWIYFDNIIEKSSPWETSTSYVPAFNTSKITNWEDFLSCAQQMGLSVMPNLFNSRQLTQNSANALISSVSMFEQRALEPLVASSTITIPNGDYSASPWNLYWRFPNGTNSYVTSGCPPGMSSTCVLLNAPTGNLATNMYSPEIPFSAAGTPSNLQYLTIPVKGYVDSILILYCTGADAAGQCIPATSGQAAADLWGLYSYFGTTTPLTIPTRVYQLPTGTTGFAYKLSVAPGHSAYIGQVTSGAGRRAPVWTNYMNSAKAFVTKYAVNTTYGANILGWEAIKEPYGNFPWGDKPDGTNPQPYSALTTCEDVCGVWGSMAPTVVHDFLHDFYAAVSPVPYAQPVGIDSITAGQIPLVKETATEPVSTPCATGAVLPWETFYSDSSDFYNLHFYNDYGAITPCVNNFRTQQQWIIGEAGAGSFTTAQDLTAITQFINAPSTSMAMMPWTFVLNTEILSSIGPNTAPAGQTANGIVLGPIATCFEDSSYPANGGTSCVAGR